MEYLKWLRLNRGLEQAKVAKQVGVSQATYSDYERGQKKPRARIHAKLADVFQVPVEEFTRRLYKLNPDYMVAGDADHHGREAIAK
jgi:transcriptional regulator with XRE-family HTH domain